MRSRKSFLEQYGKKLPLGFIVMVLLFAAAIALFTYVFHEAVWEKEAKADENIFRFLSAHVMNDRLTPFMKAVTEFASATFLQIAYGCLFVFYILRKNIKRSFEIAFIGIGGFLINYVMKLSFRRTRPPHPLIDPLHNFSFPSGHATSAFIFYGLLAYLIWKTNLRKPIKYIVCSLLILFSLLIGFSRVYLRLHYPSDVAAGFCIGFAWLVLSVYVLERLKKKSDVEANATLKR